MRSPKAAGRLFGPPHASSVHRKQANRQDRDKPRVDYISTRGEAPTLGFDDVLLAGLARDGGLYVPKAWPKLAPDTIAALAGRPFAEVAVEVIHPFVGDALSRDELRAMTEEAYGRFGHAAVTPLVRESG